MVGSGSHCYFCSSSLALTSVFLAPHLCTFLQSNGMHESLSACRLIEKFLDLTVRAVAIASVHGVVLHTLTKRCNPGQLRCFPKARHCLGRCSFPEHV